MESSAEQNQDFPENDTTRLTVGSSKQPPALIDENLAPAGQGREGTSIHAQISLLDSLMMLAAELVLRRNQLLPTVGSDDFRNVEAMVQAAGSHYIGVAGNYGAYQDAADQ